MEGLKGLNINRNHVIGYNKVNNEYYGKESEPSWKFCNR